MKDIKKDIAQAYKQMQKLGRREKAQRVALRDETRLLNKELRQKESKSVQDVIAHANVIVCTAVSARDRYIRNSTFDVVVCASQCWGGHARRQADGWAAGM